MSTPQNPLTGMDPAALMGQAQQTLQNPMAQAVPQGGGSIDPTQHPVIAALIKALSTGAQSYGWTAMQPDERLARQQMEQKKAETLAGLAGTQASREMTYSLGQQKVGVEQQRADTAQRLAEFKTTFEPQRLAEKQNHDQAMEALGQGRIDVAQQRADSYLQAVKNRYDIAEKQVGLGAGRLAVSEDLANISLYRAKLESVAVQQAGTAKGQEAITALAKLESDNWIQNMLGMSGISTLKGALGQSTPMPGAATPTLDPTAAPPTAMPTPPPAIGANPKAAAKTNQLGGTPATQAPTQRRRIDLTGR